MLPLQSFIIQAPSSLFPEDLYRAVNLCTEYACLFPGVLRWSLNLLAEAVCGGVSGTMPEWHFFVSAERKGPIKKKP